MAVTREIDLGHGVKVMLHAPDGFDDLKGWGIGLNVEADDHPRVKELGATGYALARDRFQNAMAITDSITGVDFALVTAQDTPEVITDAFIRFMSLPRAILKRWTSAIDSMSEVFNDSDLLPSGKVGKQALTDPLPSESADNSTPK